MAGNDGPITLTDPYGPPPKERYEKLGEIGKGAMGRILAAKDLILGRTVALKRINAGPLANAHQHARFVAEMQITAQLDHPNIIPVYDQDNSDSSVGYAMKLVVGRTLAEVIASAAAEASTATAAEIRRGLRERIVLLLGMCDAMDYAHSRGVLHRDLKPKNIMIGPYHEVYIVDWGIARVAGMPEDLEVSSDTEGLTETLEGTIVGSPPYMSPEQARGENSTLSPACDQYSLGLLLGELITLKRMRQGKNATMMLMAAGLGRRKDWPSRDPRGKRIQPDLAAILRRATELEPTDRYSSVADLAADLRRYLAGEPVSVRPPPLRDRVGRVMARHRTATLVLLLAAVALASVTTTGSLIVIGAQQAWAEARETALTRSIDDVTERAHNIDNQLLAFEGHLKGLASAAEYLLSNGRPVEDRVFFDTDYEEGGVGPSDLRPSAIYATSVSFEHPAAKLAPGVDVAAVLPDLELLWPIRRRFRAMMLESGGAAPNADAFELVGTQGVPLLWTYVALEEGVHVTYPGHGPYPVEYDPRKRPWYRLSAGKRGLFWGNAYPDVNGRGLILPCTTSLFDEHGGFIGVAGVELTFETIIRDLLDNHELGPGEEAFLVDPQGRVVVQSSKPGGEVAEGLHGNRELRSQHFEVPEVVAAILAGQSGYVENADKLVIYRRLDRLGWYYLVSGPARPVWSVR